MAVPDIAPISAEPHPVVSGSAFTRGPGSHGTQNPQPGELEDQFEPCFLLGESRLTRPSRSEISTKAGDRDFHRISPSECVGGESWAPLTVIRGPGIDGSECDGTGGLRQPKIQLPATGIRCRSTDQLRQQVIVRNRISPNCAQGCSALSKIPGFPEEFARFSIPWGCCSHFPLKNCGFTGKWG